MSASDEAPPPGRNRALLALGVGFGVLPLDGLMISGAAPTLAGELQGVELLSWLFTSSLLTWTACGPLFGKLTDVYGRRPILLTGLGLFSAGALIAMPAQSMEHVIVGRLIQGMGAGAIQPSAYTAAADLYRPAERAKAQVLFSLVYLLASIVAPPLTGFLVAEVSWRAVFAVIAVLGLLCALAVRLTLREHVVRQPRHLDLVGAAALMVGAGSLMLALAQVGRGMAVFAPEQLGLYALSAAATAGFVWQQWRAPEPLLPLTLLRSRIVIGACLVVMFMGVGIWGYASYAPLLVQGVLGGSPFMASLISLPFNAAWLVTNVLAVPLLWRWGYRATCLIGMTGMVVGYLTLSVIGHETPAAYGVVLLGMTVIGLGLGFVNTAAVVAVQNAAAWGERGTATACQQFFRSFGPSLLISGLQAVLNAQFAAQFAARDLAVEQLGSLGGGARLANALLAPELRDALSAPVLDALRLAMEVALHETFALIALVGVLGILCAWLLPGGDPGAHVWRGERTPASGPAVAGSG